MNHGERVATDTVFLFIHHKVASIVRPVLELRGFEKISLKPGESGRVVFSVRALELRFPGARLEPVFEPGEIEILVGACADRKQLLAGSIQLRAAVA